MSEYLDELERAARGESVDPRRLARLKQIEARETAAANELAAAAREIEQARSKYHRDGEDRMAKARPAADKAHEELVAARAAVAEAEANLKTARESLRAAKETQRVKFGELWRIADDVWDRGGVPRDNDGNPTVELCAVDWNRVVVGDALVYADRDTGLSW